MSNQQLITDFIEHLKLGKPIMRQKKKPIGDKTAYKYKLWLNKLDQWFGKDFQRVTEKDMDNFRKQLKDDVINKANGEPYKNSVKRDIEYKIMGCFFKWLGKQDLVYYTDNYREETEIPALRREEIERMINVAGLRDKVILTVLFDGGLRAGEFLNLRFCDIKDDTRKSNGYYKVRIVKSKTKPRTVALNMETTTEALDAWLTENQEKKGSERPVVQISHAHLIMALKRLGAKVLKKKVWPHLLRHSSATWYCSRLNHYQMCKRYGWSMGSNMPKVYIDTEGIEEEETNNHIAEKEAETYKQEIYKLNERYRLLQQSVEDLLKERIAQQTKA